MNTLIKYYRKNNYGSTHYYIKDQSQQQAIQKISNFKTLSPSIMEGLKDLGFNFQEVIPA